MDQACFIGSSKAHANFSTIIMFEGDIDPVKLKETWRKGIVTDFEKFSYCIRYLFGDLYYEKMDTDTAFARAVWVQNDPEKTLKS